MTTSELEAQLEKERARAVELQLRVLVLEKEVRNLNKAAARNRRLATRRHNILREFKRELVFMSQQRGRRI